MAFGSCTRLDSPRARWSAVAERRTEMAKTLSQRNWFRYTDENADTLSVQVQDVLGKNVDFGFATVNAADAVAGKGLRLRGIYVKHPTDGRVRFLPCGTGVCDAYSVLGYSLNIKDEGD